MFSIRLEPSRENLFVSNTTSHSGATLGRRSLSPQSLQPGKGWGQRISAPPPCSSLGSARKGVQMDYSYQLERSFLCSPQSKRSENKACVEKAELSLPRLCLVSDESLGEHCLRNPDTPETTGLTSHPLWGGIGGSQSTEGVQSGFII